MVSELQKYKELPEYLRLLSDYLMHVDFEYKKIKNDSTASKFYSDYWYFRQWLKNELGRKPLGVAVNDRNHFLKWSKIKLKVDGESLREMQDAESYEPKIRRKNNISKVTMVRK